MTRPLVAAGVLIALVAVMTPAGPAEAAQGASAAPATRTTAEAQRAVVDRYCVTCHNARNQTNAGHLDLSSVDLARPEKHADVLEKVITKLRAGLMPPAGQRRPDPADRMALVTYLERALDRAGATAPNPGRTHAFHRLNRAEYRNAVRDLLGTEVDVLPLLPVDDASFGFDNIAGVLKISQSSFEQYLAVARRISHAAIGGTMEPTSAEYRVPETLNQYDHIDGLPFGTRGGLQVRHEFPQDGEYEFAVELRCRIHGECDGSVGFPDTHRLLILVDGAEVTSFTLDPRMDNRLPAERIWRVRVPLKAGPHAVAATFEKLPSYREVDSTYARWIRPIYITGSNGELLQHTIYQPYVDLVTISGPFNAVGAGMTPARRRLYSCVPPSRQRATGDASAAQIAVEEACARAIFRTLTRRAFRRPVTTRDVDPILEVYRDEARVSGFESGIEAGLQRLLVSPQFLYRVEQDPAGAAPGTNYRIGDVELASRLSFFLWSSIPDEPLLTAAARGRLKDPGVLERQVRRMLDDRRSDAFVENFAGQWLWLRNLQSHFPDKPLFPNFDDSLRMAARRESELLFATVLRENRPVMELLTADYTFVNERLARHYGIPGIAGAGFQRVRITNARRRGILGHASILTVTSRPNRTSPVIRGKWIVDNILGTPAPDPPPDVPSLKEEEVGAKAKLGSMRERMMAHRINPVCSGCHAALEPSGLALENFDAVGTWRDLDESMKPVDASGAMPDGTTFEDLRGFRAALASNSDAFATALTRKLMTYALGRGLEPHDMPAVRRIVRDAKPVGLTLSSLVTGIVHSVPFQMRRTANAGAQEEHR